MYAYTYTLLRYVHDIATREFVTVGVILHAPQANFIGARFRKSYGRIKDVFPDFEGGDFKLTMSQLEQAFERLGQRQATELPFKTFENAQQIGTSVLPKDDSSLQWSELGSGVTKDPQAELEALYSRLVAHYDSKTGKRGRTDDQVWGRFRTVLHRRNLQTLLTPKTVSVGEDEFVFENAIQNGAWHCFQPVSLDLASTESIRDKALRELGRATSLSLAEEDIKLYLLLGSPRDKKLLGTYQHMVSLIEKTGGNKCVVMQEDDAERLADIVERAASHGNGLKSGALPADNS